MQWHTVLYGKSEGANTIDLKDHCNIFVQCQGLKQTVRYGICRTSGCSKNSARPNSFND